MTTSGGYVQKSQRLKHSMSKKSQRAFGAIKIKWQNDDDRQKQMETKRMLKAKRKGQQ